MTDLEALQADIIAKVRAILTRGLASNFWTDSVKAAEAALAVTEIHARPGAAARLLALVEIGQKFAAYDWAGPGDPGALLDELQRVAQDWPVVA